MINEHELPIESRIFVRGKFTDFEENLFLQREVKDLKIEIEALLQKLEDSDYEHTLSEQSRQRSHEAIVRKQEETIQRLRARVDEERQRGLTTLAELERQKAIMEMTGLRKHKAKANNKQNGLNYKKKVK